MTENTGVENSGSVIHYDEDLPVIGTGRLFVTTDLNLVVVKPDFA